MKAKAHRQMGDLPKNAEQAARIQENLARKLVIADDFDEVSLVAGLDAAYPEDGPARAAAAVLTYPGLEFVEGAVVEAHAPFPYLPGLFCFREGPLVLDALDSLAAKPHLLLADGHGIAHPRRMGLAAWVGLKAALPCIGVAKTSLAGLDANPGEGRGEHEPLEIDGSIVGYVLRTQTGVHPVYVSPGYRVSPRTALEFALDCSPGFRIPEPIRRAHALAGGGA